MKLQLTEGEGPLIKSFYEGVFVVNDETHKSSVLVQSGQSVTPWRPQTLADLNEDDICDLLALKPAVVLLGTGDEQVFPDLTLLAPLYAAQIGVEVMDTPAACRTYNVMMSEGREVMAALLL